MLKNRGAALVLILFIAFVGLAEWSDHSFQKALDPSDGQSQQEATSHQRPDDPLEILGHAVGWFLRWTTKDAISFYTAILALFTGTLGAVAIVQIRYLKRADETARMSAEAAKSAAESATAQIAILGKQTDTQIKTHEITRRTFLASHRPRIHVGYIRLHPLRAGQPAKAEIWAINVGDSNAELSQLGIDLFTRRMDRAAAPVFSAVPRAHTGLLRIVEPGRQANLSVEGGNWLSQTEIDGILGTNGKPPSLELCAVGTIHYLDGNGVTRFSSIFRVFNPPRNRFMPPQKGDEYEEWDYET